MAAKQMAPNLVKTIRTPDLKTVSSLTPEVLTPSQQLRRSQPKSRTGWSAWLTTASARPRLFPALRWPAKTGTAELGLDESGVMMNNAWFTGFAPANDPEVVVTIVMPKVDVATGAQLTSPNASKLFKAVLNK